jgi:hypothetical protein
MTAPSEKVGSLMLCVLTVATSMGESSLSDPQWLSNTVNKDHAEVRSDWRGDPVQIEAEHLRRDEPAVTEVLIVLLAALLLLAGTGFSSGLPGAPGVLAAGLPGRDFS